MRDFFAGLGETLENLFLHLRGNADAVVRDTDPQPLPCLFAGFAEQRHLDADFAAFGELDRVGQQVAQHLAQELLGAVVMLGNPLIDAATEDRVVVQRSRFQQSQYFVEQLAQREIHRFGMADALLQLGEIQHFVEDCQQAFAGLVQGIQAFAVLGIQPSAAQQFGHAENAIEGCAQFVAHGRQEPRLGKVGRFRFVLGAHQAGGAALDHFQQLVTVVLQGQPIGFPALDVPQDRPAHVVQRMGHGVDFVTAAALVQVQGFLPFTGGDTPGKLGHDFQVPGHQSIKQARQRHGQTAEKHRHPQQAGQTGGVETLVHRPEVGADFQFTQVAQRAGRRLIVQGKALDAQRPDRLGIALYQVEIGAGQVHPRDVGEVHQPAQLHVQLLLVQVPQAAFQAGQVAGADQFHARIDVAHFPSILDVQLHAAGQHGEAQAEQQNEQQQAPQQSTGTRANHCASAGRLIMSR
ncbi:hypothetical protein D9M71_278910 [compost metagenome]